MIACAVLHGATFAHFKSAIVVGWACTPAGTALLESPPVVLPVLPVLPVPPTLPAAAAAHQHIPLTRLA